MVSGSVAFASNVNWAEIWKSPSYTESGLASPSTFSALPSGYLVAVTLTPGGGASVSTVGMKFGSDGLLDCTCQAFSSFRSEEHTSELQSHQDIVCRLL